MCAVLIFSKFEREGFWSKPRNQMVGCLVLIGSGIVFPIFLNDKSVAGLFFAVVMAHQFHKVQVRQFINIYKDLESVQGKVAKLESTLQNAKILANADANPKAIQKPISRVIPPNTLKSVAQHHHQ